MNKEDLKKIVYLKKIAEQGCHLAQYKLGWMYYWAKGLVNDPIEALKWFKLSADQEDANSQYYIGVMYHYGYGVDRDHKEAVKWYKRAAEKGNVTAQFTLGQIFFNGPGVKKDNEEAIKWWKLAAKKGHAQAKGSLINIEELKKKKSIERLKSSAKQGDAKAQHELGTMYYFGDRVKVDYKKAANWALLAAGQGDPDDQRSFKTKEKTEKRKKIKKIVVEKNGN